MITNTINNNNDDDAITSVRKKGGMVDNRVILQALRVMESFGMPTSLARLTLNNVIRTADYRRFDPLTFAELYQFETVEATEGQVVPITFNTTTHSECQNEPTNGGI